MSAWNPDTIATTCSECDRNYVEWMREQHEVDLLARRDVITEAEWRRQFADWAGCQP